VFVIFWRGWPGVCPGVVVFCGCSFGSSFHLNSGGARFLLIRLLAIFSCSGCNRVVHPPCGPAPDGVVCVVTMEGFAMRGSVVLLSGLFLRGAGGVLWAV